MIHNHEGGGSYPPLATCIFTYESLDIVYLLNFKIVLQECVYVVCVYVVYVRSFVLTNVVHICLNNTQNN